MKKLIQEVDDEGLVSLLGQNVTLFCSNYIYTGILTGVNESCVLLDKAHIVYETGPFGDKKWADAQALPNSKWYIQMGAIESYGVLK